MATATKKDLIAALEDAGYEKPDLEYKSNPRGYYINGGTLLLGKNIEESLITVASMPNPNHIAKDIPKVVNAETVPKIYESELDEFGNPIRSPF